MKYYLINDEIIGIEEDGSQDYLIPSGLNPISIEVVNQLIVNKLEAHKNTDEYKIKCAKEYLTSTDWVDSYKLRHDLGLEVIPETSTKWGILIKRTEFKEFLQSV